MQHRHLNHDNLTTVRLSNVRDEALDRNLFLSWQRLAEAKPY